MATQRDYEPGEAEGKRLAVIRYNPGYGTAEKLTAPPVHILGIIFPQASRGIGDNQSGRSKEFVIPG